MLDVNLAKPVYFILPTVCVHERENETTFGDSNLMRNTLMKVTEK